MKQEIATVFLFVLMGFGLWKIHGLLDVGLKWLQRKFVRIKEVNQVLAEAQAYEIGKGARYLLVVEWMPHYRAIEEQDWLRSQGFDCIVLPANGVRLFEIQ